jgi:hypothetical protein
MVGVGRRRWLDAIVGCRRSETSVVGIGLSRWSKTATEAGGKSLLTAEEVMEDQ